MFTNILSVIDQNAEVKIPKSFEVKVKGWLGYDEKVFKEAHNQVCITHYTLMVMERTHFSYFSVEQGMVSGVNGFF